MKRFSRLALCFLLSLASFASRSSALETSQIDALEKIAAAGDPDVQLELAKAYLHGEGISKDLSKAFEWMRKAAEGGDARAEAGMGYFFATGTGGVVRDSKVAAQWFAKAAEKGDAKGLFNLGVLTLKGNGVAQDDMKGIELVRQASEKGLVEAISHQGEMYYFGRYGQEVDYQKALHLLEAASEKGDLNAMNTVGWMYQRGLGMKERDPKKAYEMFLAASEKGNAKAQTNLGQTLWEGRGVPKDRIEAWKWLLIAKDSGEITAIRTIEELGSGVSDSERMEAESRATEFRVKLLTSRALPSQGNTDSPSVK